jgi:hypothetical protein
MLGVSLFMTSLPKQLLGLLFKGPKPLLLISGKRLFLIAIRVKYIPAIPWLGTARTRSSMDRRTKIQVDAVMLLSATKDTRPCCSRKSAWQSVRKDYVE